MLLVPYGVDNPMSRLPIANWALIALNVLVYTQQLACGTASVPVGPFGFPVQMNRFIAEYGLAPASFHWYQLLTSAFLHANLLHLVGNMVFLWTFGNNVNDRLGHARYVAFYVLFALLAALGHLVANAGSPIPAVGASGAISGVMGAYLAFYPVNDVRMFYFIFIRWGAFRCSSFWIIGLWVGFDVYEALTGTAGAVGVWAHLAGFAVGFGAGLVMLWRGWTERDDFDFLSWLARRREKRPLARHGGGGGPRPGGGPLPTPPGATPAPAAPRTLGSPPEARKAMEALLDAGEPQAVQAAYEEFLRAYPLLVLDRVPQLRVANLFLRAGSHALAAEAYARFARHYPRDPQAAGALYAAGILHVERLGEPEVGRRLLEEALPSLSDAAKAGRAREILAAAEGPPGPKRVHLGE